MRILLILHQFSPEFRSGTERVSLNLAKAAQRAGHYVHVLACAIDPAASGGRPCDKLAGALQTVYEGVPVTLLPRVLLPTAADISFETNPELVEQVVAWMGYKHFDVAHVLHPMRMGSALLAAQRSGLPYLLTLTDFFSACFRSSLINIRNQLCQGPQAGSRCVKDCPAGTWTRENLTERYRQAYDLLTAAGARVCPSEYVAGRYRDAFPGLDFTVIPHGVDLLALIGGSMPPTEPAEEGLTLGFIGSLIPEKGLDSLLQALARVSTPTLKLHVVGDLYGDPVYYSEVKRLAAADSRVELLSQVSLVEVFKTIDVLCLPSRVPETFSRVLQEAAVSGVPALVSDLGAPSEHVIQFGGGRVLPVDDIDAWANAISELVACPELIEIWRAELPLPLRVEEEAFFYESFYRRLLPRI